MSEDRRKGERRVEVAEWTANVIGEVMVWWPYELRWIADRRRSERRKGE